MTDHLTVFEHLVRAETHLWAELEDYLQAEHGLALTWLVALRVLNSAPGSRVVDLASDIGITAGGASKLVDRLVAADLVARSEDAVDRRTSRLHLTSAGERVVEESAATSRRWLRVRFDALLGDTRTAQLAVVLDELARARAAAVA